MESGGTLGDRYELTEMVGAGSVGEVWRAIDTALGRIVAVKVLRAEFSSDPAVIRRFTVEARIMARLHHRGIAALYDSGQDPDGTAYLVMSFVEGESLRRILAREGPLPAARVMSLVAEAADALEAAHAAGVIHRDVKPVNLLVRPDGSVVLTDFGIARAAGNDLTGVGLVVGTVRYLAPEQAAGGDLTPAVDIYALGVTAYECLTGEPPFDGDSPLDVARQHIVSMPPQLPRRVPEPVRELVAAMLAKDPYDRPTAEELSEAARAAAEGRFPAAWAMAPVRAGRTWDRRVGVLVGAAAGLLGVLGMFAVAAFAPGEPSDSRGDPPPVVVTNSVEPGATSESTSQPSVPVPTVAPRTGRPRVPGPVLPAGPPTGAVRPTTAGPPTPTPVPTPSPTEPTPTPPLTPEVTPPPG